MIIRRCFFAAAAALGLALATLGAVPTSAQSERPGAAVKPRVGPPPREAPDAWCRLYDFRLDAIDQAVCADRALIAKHDQVAGLQRTLQGAAGLPRSLLIGQQHKAWLEERAQCAGADVTACLDRLYDARIVELAEAIMTERQQGRQQ
jgi:hypothetical protein